MTDIASPSRSVTSELTRSDEYEAICASEDLAHIGSIQRLGFLLVGDLRSETLVQLSDNAAACMGGDTNEEHPESMLGESMRSIIGSAWSRAVRETATSSDPIHVALDDAPLISGALWEARCHRTADYLVLEFLPKGDTDIPVLGTLELRDAVARISDADTVDQLVEVAAHVFRELTGFDRVMIYKFLPDWSGEVISEATRPGVSMQYYGNRFPAGDIPPQARKLYDEMGVRLIANTALGSARLLPAMPAGTSSPLDMSRCLLRAVSRAHVEYMDNMGIHQSMSVALHVGERLWALISCHQGQAHALRLSEFNPVIRNAEQIAALIESRLTQQLESDEHDYRNAVQDAIQRMLTTARAVGYKKELLVSLLEELRWNQNYCCIGVAIDDWSLVIHEDDRACENQPEDEAVIELLKRQMTLNGHSLFETRDVSRDLPEFGDHIPAAGILAYRPAEFSRLTLFIGLGEVLETITWAGNPNVVQKRVENGQVIISPRSSFAQWREEEHGRSRFWSSSDKKILFQIADGLRIWATSRDSHSVT